MPIPRQHQRKALHLATILLLLLPTVTRGQNPHLTGTILGAGKRPLANAAATLIEQGSPKPLGRSFTDSTGHFSLALDHPGAFYVWVAGVHHKTLVFPVYMDSLASANVRIQMEPIGYEEPSTPIFVTGAFNGYDYFHDLLPLEKQEDGTFRGTFAAPADTFAYQVIAKDSDELAVAGTQADYYVYPKITTLSGQAGRFASVVRSPDDSVTITFDPALLPSANGITESVTMIKGPPHATGILKYHRAAEELTKPFTDSLLSYLKTHEDGGRGFALSDSTQRRKILSWADTAQDDVVRRFILMKYFELLRPEADSTLARSLLAELTPASLLWSLVWSEPVNVFIRIALAAHSDSLETTYVTRVIDQHPDRRVAADFLWYRVSNLFEAMHKERASDVTVRNDEVPDGLEAAERFSIYYDKLITEYGDLWYADWAREQFAPERAVTAGKPSAGFHAHRSRRLDPRVHARIPQ